MTSTQQRLHNLERANEIRRVRRDLKADLGARHVRLSRILREDRPSLATMRVRELLLASPTLGDAKVRRTLDALGIGPTTPLRVLTPGRRERLIAFLAANYPGADAPTKGAP